MQPLEFLSVGIAQQLNLLENLIRLHVAYANSLLLAVDIVSNGYWVLRGTRGDCEFDLGMGGGELWQEGLDEATVEGVNICAESNCQKTQKTYFMPLELPAQSQ